MRVAKGKGAEILKRMILPLTACLLVVVAIPHKFGWIDAGVMALAIPLATIASFVTGYLWEHIGRGHSGSN